MKRSSVQFLDVHSSILPSRPPASGQIVAGTFAGGEIEPGTFHGGEIEPGTFHSSTPVWPEDAFGSEEALRRPARAA